MSGKYKQEAETKPQPSSCDAQNATILSENTHNPFCIPTIKPHCSHQIFQKKIETINQLESFLGTAIHDYAAKMLYRVITKEGKDSKYLVERRLWDKFLDRKVAAELFGEVFDVDHCSSLVPRGSGPNRRSSSVTSTSGADPSSASPAMAVSWSSRRSIRPRAVFSFNTTPRASIQVSTC